MRQEPHPADARKIDVNGLRMSVRVEGSGDPVLLLHGFPQSSRMWAPVAADLAGDVRVIAPDLRGAGDTDAPSEGYESATLLADLVGLMDALHLDRVAVVAHDWSAVIAFELCLRHPARVSSLVAIAVPAPYIRMNPKLAVALARAIPHLWFQWAIATPVIGPRLLSGGRQRLVRWMTLPMPADDARAYAGVLRDPARARAASRLYRGLIIPAFINILRGTYHGRVLRTRTLILFGGDDALIPRDALAVSPEDAPDTSIEFIPGGAHFLVDEQPEAVTRRIRDFLGLPRR